MTAGATVSDLAFRVLEALEGRGDLQKAAKELAEAARPDDEEQWEAAFEAQYNVCRQVEMILDTAGEGKGDAWQLAMCYYVSEYLAERTRRYLHLTPDLPEEEAEPQPAACPTCGAGRTWGDQVGEGRRLAVCDQCGSTTLDTVP